MIKEFKQFVMRGNVLDLAVGIIIGAVGVQGWRAYKSRKGGKKGSPRRAVVSYA